MATTRPRRTNPSVRICPATYSLGVWAKLWSSGTTARRRGRRMLAGSGASWSLISVAIRIRWACARYRCSCRTWRRGNVGVSTQNQALAALLFLYGEVLHRPLELW